MLRQEETYEWTEGSRRDQESLRLTVGLIVRSLPIIIATTAFAVLGSLAFTAGGDSRYRAVASIGFNSGPFQQAVVGGYNPVDIERQLDTSAYLLQQPAVTSRVGHRLQRRSASFFGVQTSVPKNSNIIRVTAEADGPQAAAEYANVTVEEFLRFREQLNESTTAEARRTLQRQTAAAPTRGDRRELLAKRNNLDALSALENDQVQIVGRAEAPAKADDSLVRNALIAGVLGLLLGLAISLLRPRYRPPAA